MKTFVLGALILLTVPVGALVLQLAHGLKLVASSRLPGLLGVGLVMVLVAYLWVEIIMLPWMEVNFP
jgi:hypothetical protein